jgi:adenylate kinase family enzyme
MPHDRITIWGNSGSGKSTLAEMAGAKLGLPVFHLDLIAWEPDWRFRNEAEFLGLQHRWLEQPRWIIEGVGGWAGLIERFRRADLIVHLDTPLSYCDERAKLRMAEDRNTKNRFMSEGCCYSDVAQRQLEIIRHFDGKLRDEIDTLLQVEFAAKALVRLDGTQTPDALCREFLARVLAV